MTSKPPPSYARRTAEERAQPSAPRKPRAMLVCRRTNVLARFVKHAFTMNLPRNILVPVDLGEQTESVLDYAVALAARLDARIHLLHVLGRPLLGAETGIVVTETVSDEIIARCQSELDRLTLARASKVPFAQIPLRFGDPRTEIQAAAAEIDAELIVMGTHGRRGMSRLVLGSVAESIARTARCPVLLVRAGVESTS